MTCVNNEADRWLDGDGFFDNFLEIGQINRWIDEGEGERQIDRQIERERLYIRRSHNHAQGQDRWRPSLSQVLAAAVIHYLFIYRGVVFIMQPVIK